MNYRKLNRIWDDEDLSPHEKLVMILILDIQGTDPEANPGLEYMSKKCGLSPSSLSKITSGLAIRGKISKRRTRGTARYSVFPDLKEVQNGIVSKFKTGFEGGSKRDLKEVQIDKEPPRKNHSLRTNKNSFSLLDRFRKNPSTKASYDGKPVLFDEDAEEFHIDLGSYRVNIPPSDHDQIQIH